MYVHIICEEYNVLKCKIKKKPNNYLKFNMMYVFYYVARKEREDNSTYIPISYKIQVPDQVSICHNSLTALL